MLSVGVIGYGGRGAGVVRQMGVFGIPYEVAAITDPRADEIRKRDADGFLKDTRFYADADEMLDSEELDGVVIATNCHVHTPMACKVAKRNLPLFLEKPVAVSFEQIDELREAFADVTAPVVVSFPLRLTPIVQRVKEIVEAGTIGSIEHVIAWNDVPYGHGYYKRWHRNYDMNQGLFLQKATHDFDYIFYLLDQDPKLVCAMSARRVYGGDKPWGLTCDVCDERETCPEGPVSLFYERFHGKEVVHSRNHCCFSDGIEHQDCSNTIIEFENGVQASYAQNFFARNSAARRGARLIGYKGTIEFDWYANTIKVFDHITPATDVISFTGEMPHFGGDRELGYDFLMAMRDGRPTRADLRAGIASSLACLCARQSARTRQFVEIPTP